MTQAVLIGYYGAGNLGDELMLICLNRWLLEQQIAVTVIADDAPQVHALHGLGAVQNYPLLGQFAWKESLLKGKAFETLRAVFKADLVLCGGGDLIRDQVGWRIFTFQVEKLVAGYLLRKPIYLINVGVSKPVTWYGRAILKFLLPRCAAIIVRDSRSVEICRQLGAGGRTQLQPDIVRRIADFFPPAAHPYTPPSTMLVALHGEPNVYGHYDMTAARIANLAALLDSVIEQYDLDVHFFPFHASGYGLDSQMHSVVQSAMKRARRATCLSWTLDIPEIARRFSQAKLVLAMRLHAAVLAVAYRKPCVLMPYDTKLTEFAQQTGIPYQLSPQLLDDLPAAKQLLADALSQQIKGNDLASDQDWLTLKLPS